MMKSSKPNPNRRGRGIKRTVLGLVVALSATLGLSAWAQHGPGGHGGMGMLGGAPAHLNRMLDGVNATDAQRTQIKQIAQAAAADMKALHDARRALREKGMQLFTAPTVDAAAAEQLRQQMLVQHDQTSRRTLQAMLDVSAVLTPDQRIKFGERMKQRGDRMREHSDQMRERMQRRDQERLKS